MRLLLVSTYELGHQPVQLAGMAAALSAAGLEVSTVDLSVEDFEPSRLAGVDAVAISTPMHTAIRLARGVATRVRELRPELPIAFFGLYASVGSEWTLDGVADAVFAGEIEEDLVAWALGGATGRGKVVGLGRTQRRLPRRHGLPHHDQYARLEWAGKSGVAAAVEASRGCRHRCRHCPIPVLYDGRLRLVGEETVLADIAGLADAGVEHVSFTDPDFLNAPRYSRRILERAHAAHPELTFDVTVKVEHILRHREVWAEMAELRVLFVVSAFESVDPVTLDILDKGHSVVDMAEAVGLVRSAGIHLRPTWLPFLPWTTMDHIVDLARFLDTHRLWTATDPVQMGIRLLVPDGSLLLDRAELASRLGPYRPEGFGWSWEFDHEEVAELQRRLEATAAAASDCDAETLVTLEEMRLIISEASGTPLGPLVDAGDPVPRLSESWFCCAEPTGNQAVAVGLGGRT